MKRFVLVPYDQYIRSQTIINRKTDKSGLTKEPAMSNNNNNHDHDDDTTSATTLRSMETDTSGSTSEHNKDLIASPQAISDTEIREKSEPKADSLNTQTLKNNLELDTKSKDENIPKISKKRQQDSTPPENVLQAAINDSAAKKTITSDKIWIIS
jgi:hypothetical protein